MSLDVIVDPRLAQARFERDGHSLLTSPGHYARVGIRIVHVEFPVIEAALLWERLNREVILHVEAEDYDYLPPRGWWVDEGGTALQPGVGRVPHGLGFQASGHPHGLPRTWFCFPGWREYHDHQSHQSPTWASLRSKPEYRILARIVQLHADLNRQGVQAV